MSKERELLKRVRDVLRELEETHYDLYWDIQTELDLDEQDVVTKELTELLERVLFAWGMGRLLSEENDLYMDAHYYLKGLKDDAND
jgi:hypothetical protein